MILLVVTVLELAAISASPLRALPNFTKRHRDGRSVIWREQHWGIRTPACCAAPDLLKTRVHSERHWPRSCRKFAPAQTVWPQRSTVRPLVARRSFSCRRPAQGSRCGGDREEAAGGAHWMEYAQDKSENRSSNHHEGNLRKQTRTAVKRAVQAEQLGQGCRGAKAKDGEAN